MKKLSLFLSIGSVVLFAQEQQRTITGVIKDFETRQAVVFCDVIQENSNNNTISDKDGNFIITIDWNKENTSLIFQTEEYEIDTLQLDSVQNHYTVYLYPKSVNFDEIVITGTTRATLLRESPVPIIPVSSKQIERTAGSNMIDVLVKNVPGLTAVKTGTNISKPFIRGLGYNRVLTLYDGIRQEGQQYGDEHGVEIDDYSIERAEIIKGPASLLYGSDAIAGVISLFPYIPKQKDRKLHGKFISEYQTNNNLIGKSLRLNYSDEHFLFALNSSFRIAKNYRNPIDGRVYLTNFNVRNFSTLIGYKSETGFSHLNFTLYDNRQGIPDGSRDSVSRKFTKQVFEGDDDDILNRPIVSQHELNSYKVPDLAQHIQHYRVYLHSFYQIGKSDIDVLVGGQQNIRREYTHPSTPQQAGMYMRLNTLNYSVRYNAPKIFHIETSLGVNGFLQNNKNKDATDFPIPDYNLYDGGIYLYGKWKQRKWSISGGIRYDWRRVHWNDFYVGMNPLTGFEQQVDFNYPDADLQFEAYKKLFYGTSGSIGVTFQATKNIGLKFNVGRAYRAPNITEIGSNGLDPGAHIIYLGNRNFEPEFSLQEDLGIYLKFKDVSGEISFFNNTIQNYIYMATVADEAGNPLIDGQGNRTYQYQQSKAQLYGAEFWLTVHPQKLEGFHWDTNLSMIYGLSRNADLKEKADKYLPLIPPLMINSSISQEIKPHSKLFLSFTPKAEVEYSAAQNKYLALNGTETPTPSYTLLNLGVFTEIKYAKTETIQLLLQVNNLFDKAYQSHLSRLKYFEYYSESSQNHYGIYNMGRNFIFKLIVPF